MPEQLREDTRPFRVELLQYDLHSEPSVTSAAQDALTRKWAVLVANKTVNPDDFPRAKRKCGPRSSVSPP